MVEEGVSSDIHSESIRGSVVCAQTKPSRVGELVADFSGKDKRCLSATTCIGQIRIQTVSETSSGRSKIRRAFQRGIE